jgi:hypothetical protein
MKELTIILMIFIPFASSSTEYKKDEKEFFKFEPDIRLFTTYAFMNAAGFNHDWKDTMHPIRIEIRNYLDSVLTDNYKKIINDYYNKMGGGDFYGYGAYALNSKFPPNFGLICDSCRNEYIDKFVDYDSLLRDFYVKAHIEKLWEKYKVKLYEINIQYKPFAEMALKQITDYCRVDSNYFRNIAKGNFYYQQIPLMSYFTAFFHETGNDYWVISGPSDGQPGPSGFYHESLHRIINPIVENNSKINIKIQSLVELSQEKLKGDYHSDTAILCESFVRTIDKILSSRYYKNSKDELYHELIANIDLEYEKSRWISYWKDKNNE